MDFGLIVNYLLYSISGFFFAIFASRYSVLAVKSMKELYQQDGTSALFSCLPQILFLFCCFFLFPSWFTSRTPMGGFVYYAVLLYFFGRGYHTYIRK